MRILTSIELTEEQVAKIGWQTGQYPEDPLTKDEVRDYIDTLLSDTINNLPSPPQVT